MKRLLASLLLLTALPAHGAGRVETFVVDGVRRQALVVPNSRPAPRAGAPLVLAFHGHGGTAAQFQQKLGLERLWPQAVVVYLQGIPGVPGITDPEGSRNGWQKNPGEVGDRDLRFVDAVLARLQRDRKVDPRRIYALGHSNGGRFTHVLWNQRGERFAAYCTGAAPGGEMVLSDQPQSAFVIAGRRDPLVPYSSMAQTIEDLRDLLHTDPAQAAVQGYLRLEPGLDGDELATYVHPGGHAWPDAATPLVVQFFQRHARP